MIIRKLKHIEFERLRRSLIEKAYVEPLEASFTVKIVINGEEYSISGTAGDAQQDGNFAGIPY